MFGEINYLSVTIYALGGILVLATIILMVYRFFTKNKTENVTENKIGKVNKEFNDLIKFLASTTKFEIMHNILIKNKYAKNNYSLIPALILVKNNLFLLTNAINLDKYDQGDFFMENKHPFLYKNKKVRTNFDLNFTFSKEIKKYMQHNFDNVPLQIVIPCVKSQAQVKHGKELNIVDIMSFTEEIVNLVKSEKEISNQLAISIASKLKRNNLFKAKVNAKSAFSLKPKGQHV